MLGVSEIWSYRPAGRAVAVSLGRLPEALLAGDDQGGVYYFLPESSAPAWTHRLSRPVRDAAVSADGRHAAVLTDGGGVTWFDGEGRVLWSYDTASGAQFLDLHPSGTRAVVGGGFDRQFILDLPTGQAATFSFEQKMAGLRIIPRSAEVICVAESGNISFFTPSGAPGERLHVDAVCTDLCIDDEGQRILIGTGAGGIICLDRSGRSAGTYTWGPEVVRVVQSAAGRRVFAFGPDRQVCAFDPGGAVLWEHRLPEPVSDACLNGNGSALAVCSRTGALYRYAVGGSTPGSPSAGGVSARFIEIDAPPGPAHAPHTGSDTRRNTARRTSGPAGPAQAVSPAEPLWAYRLVAGGGRLPPALLAVSPQGDFVAAANKESRTVLVLNRRGEVVGRTRIPGIDLGLQYGAASDQLIVHSDQGLLVFGGPNPAPRMISLGLAGGLVQVVASPWQDAIAAVDDLGTVALLGADGAARGRLSVPPASTTSLVGFAGETLVVCEGRGHLILAGLDGKERLRQRVAERRPGLLATGRDRFLLSLGVKAACVKTSGEVAWQYEGPERWLTAALLPQGALLIDEARRAVRVDDRGAVQGQVVLGNGWCAVTPQDDGRPSMVLAGEAEVTRWSGDAIAWRWSAPEHVEMAALSRNGRGVAVLCGTSLCYFGDAGGAQPQGRDAGRFLEL